MRGLAAVHLPHLQLRMTNQSKMEEIYTAIINLKNLYPFYEGDSYVDIPDDVLAEIENCERHERTYKRYLRYHRANISLDVDNPRGIEHDVVDKPVMPHEAYEEQLMNLFLYKAIRELPEKQAQRIYSHFFLGMSKKEIAEAEGVSDRVVRRTIAEGLEKIKDYLLSNI